MRCLQTPIRVRYSLIGISQGLFASLRCPDADTCKRCPCPYSHKPAAELPKPTSLIDALLPVPRKKLVAPTSSTVQPISTRADSTSQADVATTAKRPAQTPSTSSSSNGTEPPRKIQKVIPVTAVRRTIIAVFRVTLFDYVNHYCVWLVWGPTTPGKPCAIESCRVRSSKACSCDVRSVSNSVYFFVRSRPRSSCSTCARSGARSI